MRHKWQLEAPEGIIGPPDLPATTLARAGSTWWLFSISPPKWTLLPRTALCEGGMLTGAFAVKCESPKASPPVDGEGGDNEFPRDTAE